MKYSFIALAGAHRGSRDPAMGQGIVVSRHAGGWLLFDFC